MDRAKRFAEGTFYLVWMLGCLVRAVQWLVRGSGSPNLRIACVGVLAVGFGIVLATLLLRHRLSRSSAGVVSQELVPLRGDVSRRWGPGALRVRRQIPWLSVVRPGLIVACMLAFLAAVGTFVPSSTDRRGDNGGTVASGNPSPTPSTTPSTEPPNTEPATDETTAPPASAPVALVRDGDVVLHEDLNCGNYSEWKAEPVTIHGTTYEKGSFHVGGSCATSEDYIMSTATYVLSRRFSRFQAVVGVLDTAPPVTAIRIELMRDGEEDPVERRYINVGKPWKINVASAGVVQFTIRVYLHDGLPSGPLVGVAGGVGYP